jgi:hypothetical protein
MKTFLTGNVIKTAYGHIEIVFKVRDDNYIETIPIEYTNTTIGHYREDKTYKRNCDCGGFNEDCLTCAGSGTDEYEILGFERAEFIAATVKDYIIASITKNFNF